MMEDIEETRKEIGKEFFSILRYWQKNTVDEVHGGFAGEIDSGNKVIRDAAKGSVLHARIVWTFAVAYTYDGNSEYLALATRGYRYIRDHFIDNENGGVYWTVDAEGRPLDTKKQIYAIAFCLYACSEYYAASKDPEALQLALELFHCMEGRSHDPVHDGYLESFAKDWKPLADTRLSAKDVNEKKTLNTHLHIVEAYSNLYRVHPEAGIRNRIIALLKLFDMHFIDPQSFHLRLFFDERWNEKRDVISYGHDIEAAWLLLDCAKVIGDGDMIEKFMVHGQSLANAAAKGLDTDGGMWYEYDISHRSLVREKHWWVQAEAMIGFYRIWEISGVSRYLDHSLKCWKFIQEYLVDRNNGEWFWGVDESGHVLPGHYKTGLWKCPYHNTRACLQMMKGIV